MGVTSDVLRVLGDELRRVKSEVVRVSRLEGVLGIVRADILRKGIRGYVAMNVDDANDGAGYSKAKSSKKGRIRMEGGSQEERNGLR